MPVNRGPYQHFTTRTRPGPCEKHICTQVSIISSNKSIYSLAAIHPQDAILQRALPLVLDPRNLVIRA